MTKEQDIKRVQECLAYIRSNHDPVNPAWVEEVRAEARRLGLLPPLKPVVGQNCRPGIDARIVYGGDYVDAF